MSSSGRFSLNGTGTEQGLELESESLVASRSDGSGLRVS
jgi:hypothetical protein